MGCGASMLTGQTILAAPISNVNVLSYISSQKKKKNYY